MSEGKFGQLRLFNGVMGVFHLVQGLVMLAVSNDFTLPITTSYLKFDLATRSITTNPETIADLRIGPIVALFLFLSALAHFVLVLPGVYQWYVAKLKQRINYVRWYEYALSSSVMIVVIAMLCGMYDLGSLILLFTLNAMMNLFGLLMELHNQTTGKTNWTAYIFGCIAGIVPWVVIGMYFIGAANSVNVEIPEFVYYILASIFVFFSIFALNMYLQYAKVWKWQEYLFGERMYIVLSLVAKSALAWQIFSGTLRPM